jgi:demethylmenaquinone methyltransferase/2-methoxy-6-polyprenyl-1,4-benzoquinol methylase
MNAPNQPATGARPEGAPDELAAANAVRGMFDSIAPRYDLLNHVLSASVCGHWWRRAARTFSSRLADPKAQVLDLCCGTGDMTLALLRRRPSDAAPLLAVDFSHQMLLRGIAKFPAGRVRAIEADALHLPLENASLDLVVSAFGFRNLANYSAGLAEIHRVLRPGGEIGILDFSEPGGLLGPPYRFYFRHILPRIGSLISGRGSAYTYLPASVSRFPAPPRMLELMTEAGYSRPTWTPYSFGIAGLYRAVKS